MLKSCLANCRTGRHQMEAQADPLGSTEKKKARRSKMEIFSYCIHVCIVGNF